MALGKGCVMYANPCTVKCVTTSPVCHYLDLLNKGPFGLSVLLDDGLFWIGVVDVGVEVVAVLQFRPDGGQTVGFQRRRFPRRRWRFVFRVVYRVLVGRRKLRIAERVREFPRPPNLVCYFAQIDDLAFVDVAPTKTALETACSGIRMDAMYVKFQA